MGCPFFLEVVRGSSNTPVPFEGTGYPCLTVGSSLTIPAQDSLVYLRWVSTSVDDEPTSPGLYRARLDFTNEWQSLETEFRVR